MRKAIFSTCGLALCSALFLASCAREAGTESGNAAQATNQTATTAQNAPATEARDAQQPASPPSVVFTPTPAAKDSQSQGDVRRITVEEARAAFERGDAVFVDVRGQESFDRGHLPGAIMIPLEQVEQNAKRIPRNKLIITYCA